MLKNVAHRPSSSLLFFTAPTVPLLSRAARPADEYRSGEDDDADNEATIEEEEALAAAEGRDVKVRLRVWCPCCLGMCGCAHSGTSCAGSTPLVLVRPAQFRRLQFLALTYMPGRSLTLIWMQPHPSPPHTPPPTPLLTPTPQKEEVDELAGLDEEADLPLEELLARYGNYHLAAEAAQQEDGEEEISGDEDMPGGVWTCWVASGSAGT